jgi:hypothetical protein
VSTQISTEMLYVVAPRKPPPVSANNEELRRAPIPLIVIDQKDALAVVAALRNMVGTVHRDNSG